MIVGFLHPGAMGASLGATCRVDAIWASQDRSSETVQRANDARLRDVVQVETLVAEADVVVSICPPAAAEEQAAQIASLGFDGVYVDANAIAPQAARRIGERFSRFVDGSVIGPPALSPGTTRLYLSGSLAHDVAGLWAGSDLDARPIEGGLGAASALKMAYASWTKIGGALQLAVRALAAAEGVDDELLAEWAISQPGLAERTERVAAGVGPKAWRFVGEMEQMVDSYDAAGLPTGFAAAASDLYARLADLKGTEAPSIADVLALLDHQQ